MRQPLGPVEPGSPSRPRLHHGSYDADSARFEEVLGDSRGVTEQNRPLVDFPGFRRGTTTHLAFVGQRDDLTTKPTHVLVEKRG